MYQVWETGISYRERDCWFGKVWVTFSSESLFDSDIFLSFSSLFYGTQSLIFPLLFLVYQTHLEALTKVISLHKDLITSFAISLFFPSLGLSKCGGLRIGL